MLTMWYVNGDFKFLAIASLLGFMLTMWYVNICSPMEFKKHITSFMLTMWHVNRIRLECIV